jgi:hypothetical protein
MMMDALEAREFLELFRRADRGAVFGGFENPVRLGQPTYGLRKRGGHGGFNLFGFVEF